LGTGVIAARRRFVLTRLPEKAKSVPGLLIDEGWLPGKKIREILRRVRSRRSLAFYRILLPGPGSHQSRAEERIPRSLFDTLWPLTEKRRLRKRCYEITEGNLVWHVIDFIERELVVAEVDLLVEGAQEDSDIPLPAWLLECLKSEVTGQAKYESEALAASRTRRPRTGQSG